MKNQTLTLSNVKNNYFFNEKLLKKICNEINEKTSVINFYPQKITKTKFGLRQVILRSKYKKNNVNSQCKLLLFENSKGKIKPTIRIGFMLSFVQDINILNKIMKKYE